MFVLISQYSKRSVIALIEQSVKYLKSAVIIDNIAYILIGTSH